MDLRPNNKLVQKQYIKNLPKKTAEKCDNLGTFTQKILVLAKSVTI